MHNHNWTLLQRSSWADTSCMAMIAASTPTAVAMDCGPEKSRLEPAQQPHALSVFHYNTHEH